MEGRAQDCVSGAERPGEHFIGEVEGESTTLEAPKHMVAQLRLDIDLGEALVPGIRRGYAIIPYSTRSGEAESHLQERLRGAMSRLRQANFLTRDEGPQGLPHLWLNLSTCPDIDANDQFWRGRVKEQCSNLVGKGTNCKLSLPPHQYVSWQESCWWGTVPHSSATQIGCGWVDKGALVNMLGEGF